MNDTPRTRTVVARSQIKVLEIKRDVAQLLRRQFDSTYKG
jgi:hypothetical protein